MEEKKIKKKKLTLSVSSKKSHNAPNYTQSRGKTSVVIEKKLQEDGVKKNFNHEEIIIINQNLLIILLQKKISINRNFDIRK